MVNTISVVELSFHVQKYGSLPKEVFVKWLILAPDDYDLYFATQATAASSLVAAFETQDTPTSHKADCKKRLTN